MSLRCTVVSLVPLEINEEKPGLCPPRFRIPASDGETPQIIHVDTAHHFVYLDESRGSLQVKNPSDIIAKSIVEDYKAGQMGVDDECGPAIFWIDKELTLDEVMKDYKVELMKLRLRQRQWLLNICMIADNDWQRYHQHNVISSFQREAAKMIGWDPKDHEWMTPAMTMQEGTIKCPYCGLGVPPGLSRCPNNHIANVKLEFEIQQRLNQEAKL
jgi:hypothetical protein